MVNQFNEIGFEERSPEKAGVGGSIPSLATMFLSTCSRISNPVCPISVPIPFSFHQVSQLIDSSAE